jgi:hypothetical protein
LASRLLQSAFLGLKNASAARDLGEPLPNFLSLAEAVAQDLLAVEPASSAAFPAPQQQNTLALMPPQQPEQAHTVAQRTSSGLLPATGPSDSADGVLGSAATTADAHVVPQEQMHHASPAKQPSPLEASRKRPADADPDVPRKRQQVGLCQGPES